MPTFQLLNETYDVEPEDLQRAPLSFLAEAAGCSQDSSPIVIRDWPDPSQWAFEVSPATWV